MSEISITIREARPSDLPVCHRLLADALEHDALTEHLAREKLFPDAWQPGMDGGVLVAEDDAGIVGLMQHVLRPSARRAWVGLFAVEAAHRRQGIARRLFELVCAGWPSDLDEIEVLAIPGNYFAPGLDPRYTPAHAFLESAGFTRFKDCVNLRAPLIREFDTRADEARLAADGTVVRRADRTDAQRLDAFFAGQFGPDWRYEVEMAFGVGPPALHLALRDGRVIAFSAHSTQNREWGFFGPMGTAPEARGRGVGRVLLWRCLNDLRAAGHASAVIPWVGPISFYARWAEARVERVFWRYRRALGAEGGGL